MGTNEIGHMWGTMGFWWLIVVAGIIGGLWAFGRRRPPDK